MEKKSYAELLKDPRWQKKRLEIMQRDNFTCQHCLSTDKPLQVHHLVYEKGKKPWAYKNEELITLCEECHRLETEESNYVYEQYKDLLYNFKMSGFSIIVLSAIFQLISETLYSCRLGKKQSFYDEEVKRIIKSAICVTGQSGDLIRASAMGIDVTYYVEHVCPELMNEIKGRK